MSRELFKNLIPIIKSCVSEEKFGIDEYQPTFENDDRFNNEVMTYVDKQIFSMFEFPKEWLRFEIREIKKNKDDFVKVREILSRIYAAKVLMIYARLEKIYSKFDLVKKFYKSAKNRVNNEFDSKVLNLKIELDKSNKKPPQHTNKLIDLENTVKVNNGQKIPAANKKFQRTTKFVKPDDYNIN
uniref:Uncharacterized protein n=1 Tax=Meloidogyne hapla TaxID=6305 RepID=A0A1I8BK72_MELHA